MILILPKIYLPKTSKENCINNLKSKKLKKMKKLHKITVLGLLVACSYISKAQNEKVLISTIYDDPKKNSWNVGIALGFDIQNKTSAGLYYLLHGRYTLSKLLTFNVNTSLDLTKLTGGNGLIKTDDVYKKIDPYMHIEGRASFHLSDKINEIKSKVSLGSDGKYTYSTNYTSKGRVIMGLTASLNLHNQLGMQIEDSAADKRAYDVKIDNYTGYKAKTFVNQKNMILGVGFFFGDFTHSKHSFTAGPVGTKKRKLKRSMTTAIEFLFALNMNMGDKAFWAENNTLKEAEITNIEKKRMGFRIITDYGKNKIGWYQHAEMGLRPGLYAPNSQSKYLNQGYLSYGFGFGF